MSETDEKDERESIKTDPRVATIMNYTMKAFKVLFNFFVLNFHCRLYFMQARLDKWLKMTSVDENNTVINHFLDKPEFRVLVICQSSAGVLLPSNAFPDTIKSKTIYFVKRL